VAEVGDALDGDLLGAAPEAAAATAGKAAVAALAEPGATARTVHLSFGDFTAEEYAWQVLADHVVHTWDLLVAVGAPRELDPRLVEVTTGWWDAWEDAYRDAGAVGPAVPVPLGAPPQDRLVASFGRDPSWTVVHDVVRRFGEAWEAWDLDAIMALMADDAVFESTGPAPDGVRVEGAAVIRAEWESMFAATRDASFVFEEAFVSGDRATARWTFSWTGEDGAPGHVRGVDVMRVADGKVAEKYSYVKG
jgi:ketosteroid isomerase-like protein